MHVKASLPRTGHGDGHDDRRGGDGQREGNARLGELRAGRCPERVGVWEHAVRPLLRRIVVSF